jgi:hypothetical protein
VNQIRSLIIFYFLFGFSPPVKANLLNPHFNIYINKNGVYKVSFDDLNLSNHLFIADFKKLKLSNKGRSIPFWIHDDGDGLWQANDSITFIGKHLSGEKKWNNDKSDINVYQLWLENIEYQNPSKKLDAEVTKVKFTPNGINSRSIHFEEQLLKAPLTKEDFEVSSTIWYWGKFHANSQTPFQIKFNLEGFDPNSKLVKFDVLLRGGSQQLLKYKSDHLVEIKINENKISEIQWDGKTEYHFSIDIAAKYLKEHNNLISFSIPNRRNKQTNQDIIDIVYLDWFELSYQLNPIIDAINLEFTSTNSKSISLNKNIKPTALYSQDGSNFYFEPNNENISISLNSESIQESNFYYIENTQYKNILSYNFHDQQSLINGSQTDYLIISHPAFIKSLMPLVELHESLGRNVQIIDTLSIYDLLNHGIFSSNAIKSYITDIYSNNNNQLKYVLLVGDSSWHSLGKLDLYSPSLENLSHKDLLPSWQFYTEYGSAVSDTPYTQMDTDLYPDISIGRFAVHQLKDLNSIISKTISYSKNYQSGLWKSKLGILSVLNSHYHNRNTKIFEQLESTNDFELLSLTNTNSIEKLANQIVNAINEGVLLIHFYGHGGRFMWEVGKDKDQNSVYFDKSDVSKLHNEYLPIVLSMTCSSGPFDHPNANSLIEEILNLEQYGAVASISSSARNNPTKIFSKTLLQELLNKHSLGESLMITKRKVNDINLTNLYNLLGDPAVMLNSPQLSISFSELVESTSRTIQVTVLDSKFNGEFIYVLKDFLGNEIVNQQISSKSNSITIKINKSAEKLLVYAFNSNLKLDAFGEYQILHK